VRFILTSEDFVYAMRPRPGFPIILNSQMEPAEPFHSYLVWRLLGKGAVLDPKTWDAYGRAIWDFARFLEANDLRWDQPFVVPGDGVVAMYRDWQATDLGLDAGTINQRLRQVVAFYEWAQRNHLITDLPFGYRYVTRRRVENDLAHKTGSEQVNEQANVLVTEWEKDPAFLTAGQLAAGRQAIRSASQRILWDLMARVGLRSMEARTFPLKYVFDPTKRRDLTPTSMIYVSLDPKDMDIKNDKSRVVTVPFSLMEDMWTYHQLDRNKTPAVEPFRELALTVNGRPYAKDSAVKVFDYISMRAGFKVTPLMLRHSYAVHTLLVLRGHPELQLEPLMWVRDRMGHESVSTTMVYLRQIERLIGGEAEHLMREYDAIYGIAPAPSMSADVPSN
jgi:integrase/recombinase XerD